MKELSKDLIISVNSRAAKMLSEGIRIEQERGKDKGGLTPKPAPGPPPIHSPSITEKIGAHGEGGKKRQASPPVPSSSPSVSEGRIGDTLTEEASDSDSNTTINMELECICSPGNITMLKGGAGMDINGSSGVFEDNTEFNPFQLCTFPVDKVCIPKIEGNIWKEVDTRQELNGQAVLDPRNPPVYYFCTYPLDMNKNVKLIGEDGVSYVEPKTFQPSPLYYKEHSKYNTPVADRLFQKRSDGYYYYEYANASPLLSVGLGVQWYSIHLQIENGDALLAAQNYNGSAHKVQYMNDVDNLAFNQGYKKADNFP